jgi:hypothetical protein
MGHGDRLDTSTLCRCVEGMLRTLAGNIVGRVTLARAAKTSVRETCAKTCDMCMLLQLL